MLKTVIQIIKELKLPGLLGRQWHSALLSLNPPPPTFTQNLCLHTKQFILRTNQALSEHLHKGDKDDTQNRRDGGTPPPGQQMAEGRDTAEGPGHRFPVQGHRKKKCILKCIQTTSEKILLTDLKHLPSEPPGKPCLSLGQLPGIEPITTHPRAHLNCCHTVGMKLEETEEGLS